MVSTMTLSEALPPPLWHPPFAVVPYYQYAIMEKYPVQAMPWHHMRPRHQRGRNNAKGIEIKKQVSQER